MTIQEIVDAYERENEIGLLEEEIIDIIEYHFDDFSIEKYNNAMMGNTCGSKDGKLLNYPWDVVVALKCGVEKRELTAAEWD